MPDTLARYRWFPVCLSMVAAAAFGIATASPGSTYAAAPATIPAPIDRAFSGTITLAVDATDVRHRVFSVHERIPVQAEGRITLLYPQWEPASHAATASVATLAGLVVHAGVVRLDWRRDEVDVHAFHVVVPAGVDVLDLDFQYLSPPSARSGALEMTADLINVPWHRLLLYPAGWYARNLPFAATLKLPAGLEAASSLAAQVEGDGRLVFTPVSLETLVDSPVYAARHLRRFELAPGASAPVHLDVLSDSAASVAVKPAQIAVLQSMVTQTQRLFGSRHYAHYDILVSLSDTFPSGGGLEHLESGENNLPSTFFTDAAHQLPYRDLIAHEFVHSWNGRFRQPASLWSPNYNTPVRNDLLWVYEGLTEYWGRVLAARSGLRTRQEALDAFALDAAIASARVGRAWKSLQDSNNDPLYMAGHPVPWRDWQRREDYYPEGVLLWLAVDGVLRDRSDGARSLDDFARGFFGVDDGSGVTRTYTFDDVCAALDKLVPNDWAAYLRERLDTHDGSHLFDGLTDAGYRLAFADVPTETFRQTEADAGVVDLSASIGLAVGAGAIVRSVAWRGPAFLAGLGIGDHLIAVNGRPYSDEALRAAVKAAARAPVELDVEADGKSQTLRLVYAGTLRYPRLERIDATRETLSRSLKAL